ncbi:MAG: BamA/TamA family outer membrane protein [Bacteroidales bacterium]
MMAGRTIDGPMRGLGYAIPVLILLLGGCTGLRNLGEGEKLYTGGSIHIEKESRIEDDRNVEDNLKQVLRPSPNSSFFFFRPRLWMYQVAGEPTGRGVRYWMRERLGEAPVLFEDVSLERNLRLINNRLYNMGYFDSDVQHQLDTAHRKISVDYQIRLEPPYRFGDLSPVEEDTPLANTINKHLDESLIEPGEVYSLELLQSERQRIEKLLKGDGFFFFHPDHILFQADSTAGERRVDIRLTIKKDIPASAARRYIIGDIYINADYMSRTSGRDSDTIQLKEGVFFTDQSEQFKPEAITRSLFLTPDSLYRLEDHDRSINYLISLGAFQFVNLRFSPRKSDNQHKLDVRVLLTPLQRRSVSAELKGMTKSNNFAGPGLSASFNNHNFLGGAESLRVSTNFAYEALVGGQRSASSKEFGLDADLTFPRFVFPFDWSAKSAVMSPKTSISMGLNFLTRTDAFNLTTLQARFGYVWNRDRATQFRIEPMIFNLFSLGDVDDDMEGIIVDGSLLRQGLFEQFIIGGQYGWAYNSQLNSGEGQKDWYIQFNMDVSGNLAYLLLDKALGASTGDDESFGLFNQSFAQYAKGEADVRYYHQLGEKSRLAFRLITGAGFPYGNSEVLPYVKQFVIGGSNSVRAFHPRTLGPGTFSSDADGGSAYNIHQTGDLKLEANMEYRFDITSLFKGAFFLDAGNIWRLNESENVPGGEFKFTQFHKQIALGAGTGLRIDADFFILRFDFAIPLADPATDNDRYFSEVRLFDRDWRRDHLVFNLGIGYPF